MIEPNIVISVSGLEKSYKNLKVLRELNRTCLMFSQTDSLRDFFVNEIVFNCIHIIVYDK